MNLLKKIIYSYRITWSIASHMLANSIRPSGFKLTNPQYFISWCHPTKSPEYLSVFVFSVGYFVKTVEDKRTISGPIRFSTASKILGWMHKSRIHLKNINYLDHLLLKILIYEFLLMIKMQIYFLWDKFSIGSTRFQTVKFLTNISHFIFRHHLEIPKEVIEAI